MWGAIIGAVTSVAGGIASAIGANKARKIQEEELKKREERQAATYARRVNQDYTQRADAQRMLKITRDALKQRAEAAAGRQAVMGLTDSGLAAEREMAENVMADTASQIAAAGEAQKDAIEQQYEQQQAENSKERTNIAAGKAAATGQAVGQMVQGVGQVAAGLSGMSGPKSKTPTTGLAVPKYNTIEQTTLNALQGKMSGGVTQAGEWVKNWAKTNGIKI